MTQLGAAIAEYCDHVNITFVHKLAFALPADLKPLHGQKTHQHCIEDVLTSKGVAQPYLTAVMHSCHAQAATWPAMHVFISWIHVSKHSQPLELRHFTGAGLQGFELNCMQLCAQAEKLTPRI